MLTPCEGFDLSEVKYPADYMRVAAIPEAVEKIEECMRGWIKHIEHVSVLISNSLTSLMLSDNCLFDLLLFNYFLVQVFLS